MQAHEIKRQEHLAFWKKSDLSKKTSCLYSHVYILSRYLQYIKVLFHHHDIWIWKCTRRTSIQQYPNIAFLNKTSIHNMSHQEKHLNILQNWRENTPKMLDRCSKPQGPLESHQSNHKFGQGPTSFHQVKRIFLDMKNNSTLWKQSLAEKHMICTQTQERERDYMLM